MSYRTLTYLYCDGGDKCPREGDPYNHAPIPNQRINEMRSEARDGREGWCYTTDGKDLCGECGRRLRAEGKL